MRDFGKALQRFTLGTTRTCAVTSPYPMQFTPASGHRTYLMKWKSFGSSPSLNLSLIGATGIISCETRYTHSFFGQSFVTRGLNKGFQDGGSWRDWQGSAFPDRD
jgi:hypothetical protein